MTEGVKENQAAAPPEDKAQSQGGFSENARQNFARLEAAKEAEREARIRAEMQAEAMRNELQEIKQMLQPKEKDPLDEVQDISDLDPQRLKAALATREARFKKEAEAIAKSVYEREKREHEEKNYLQRLKSEFRDYDEVMTESNIASLEKVDPVFLRTVMRNSSDYERRLDTYEKIKSLKLQEKVEDKPSIKEKVEENQRNTFFIPSDAGTPGAVEFDIKSKTARMQAYDKLKAAQRRPIGGGQTPSR
jgi:hypothetical protein